MPSQPYDLNRGPLARLFAAQQRYGAFLAARLPVAAPSGQPLTEGTFWFRCFLAVGALAAVVTTVLPLCRLQDRA